jgi:hypothetical protein
MSNPSDNAILAEFDKQFSYEDDFGLGEHNMRVNASATKIKQFLLQKLQEAREEGFNQANQNWLVMLPQHENTAVIRERKRLREAVGKLEWLLVEPYYPNFSRTINGELRIKENGFWATGYNEALTEVLEHLDEGKEPNAQG